MTDKAEPVKVDKPQQLAPDEHKAARLPGLVELAGDVQAGLVAAKNTVHDKVTGLEQFGMQLTNFGTDSTLGVSVFSKDSIDALAPQQHEQAPAYTLKHYFEVAGQALPLAVAAYAGHKFFGGAAVKDALNAEKSAASGGILSELEKSGHPNTGILNRAKSLALRDTPLGLSVRNAAVLGFASEAANPTDTKHDDSLLSAIKTRTVEGGIGAFSMAAMSAGTIGAQAAWKAFGKTTAKDAAAVVAENAAAEATQTTLAKSAGSALSSLRKVGTNAAISAIGALPGSAAGYVLGSEVHGQDLSVSGLGDNLIGATVVGGTFGLAAGLRGTPEVAAKTSENTAAAPRDNLSTRISAKVEGATQAVRDLMFGRSGDVEQLGTAMASDAKGRTNSEIDQLNKSWQGYLDFAGGTGRVQSTDVENVLKGIDKGTPTVKTLQDYADGSNSREQKALVAASVRPESRAAFLKMMEVSRDGSTAAESGFAKEVSADKQTVADLKLMTDRIGDPKLTKLVDSAANYKESDLDAIDAALARRPQPIAEPVVEPTVEPLKVRTQIADEALRQPTLEGFTQLLEAAKATGSPEHLAAFFKSVDANPKILEGVKALADNTNIPSVKNLAAMAEKPALRQAVRQLVDAAKDGSGDAQKNAFIDTVNKDRSLIPDLQKLAASYDSPRLKDLVHAADTAPVELTYKTPQEGKDLAAATKVIENLVRSGGTDVTELNRIVRDDDSLVNLQPHLRHIAERLGGEEFAKKVDEAYAGRYQEIKVQPSIDDSFPAPKDAPSVSLRSNQVKDFNQMMQTAEMLHEAFVKPVTDSDAVNPDWYYNLLRAKAQSPSGQAFESVAKDYATKMGDPRFLALINDAYLPKEGVLLPADANAKNFQAKTEKEANAYGQFTEVMKSWPKVPAGETPSPDSVLEYRARVMRYLAQNQDLHQMVVDYGKQTNSSFEASAIDYFYGTKNLERFAEARPAARGDSPELRAIKQDPVARALVEGVLDPVADPNLKYVDQVGKELASPAAHDTPYSRRMFNGQERVSQDKPAAGAGTWSVVDHEGASIANVTGHPDNLMRVIDFDNGQRIEFYGAKGDNPPYTTVYRPDNVNIKVVNPGPGAASRFKIEFPLQGNYISTDFPPDSNVVREIRWDGKTTQINRDGSVTTQTDAGYKPFDPDAYDNARKTEYKAKETEERRAQAKAETDRLVAVMSDPASPHALRIQSAKNVDFNHMSDQQFTSWLRFAGSKSPSGNYLNFHEIGAPGLDAMQGRLEKPEERGAWVGRLKNYLARPESGSEKYPDWLGEKDFASLPAWLKSDVYQRFNPKGFDAGERLPQGVTEYFAANGEPQETRTGKGDKTFQQPFQRIGDDSTAVRTKLLPALDTASPEVMTRLMELGAQDGRALQDVIKSMTAPFNNSAEFKTLIANTLPNAKDIYSVKVMLDALDKAGSRQTPEAEKSINLKIAEDAAVALAGNDKQKAATALAQIEKINKRTTTRGPKDFSTLARYTLAASSTDAVTPPREWDLDSTIPDPAEKPASDDGTASGTETEHTSSGVETLRGTGETAEAPAPEARTETPAPEARTETPAPEVRTEVKPEDTAKPAESSVDTDAQALASKIGEDVKPTGELFDNRVFESVSGRQFMVDPSGETFEKVSGDSPFVRWKDLSNNSQIWMDGSGSIWDINEDSNNIAIARDLPEGVRSRIINFGAAASDPENLPNSPQVMDGEPGKQFVDAQDPVMSTFFNDGRVEFSQQDGSKQIIGPRSAETGYKPAFETFEFPAKSGETPISVTVNSKQAMTGVLPNGVQFSAKDPTGKGTVFIYPDGVEPYEAGSQVSFENNTVTVSQMSGKQTIYSADGSVHEDINFDLQSNSLLDQLLGDGSE